MIDNSADKHLVWHYREHRYGNHVVECRCGKSAIDRDREKAEAQMAACRRKAPASKRWGDK